MNATFFQGIGASALGLDLEGLAGAQEANSRKDADGR
jgi:hypothetical protein